MPALIQPSFAKGEVGPDIYGRVDTAAYRIALRRALNVVVRSSGGVRRRGGLRFVGPCKQHVYKPRLIPFEFKKLDSHILEFGEEYIRVIRGDDYVTETAKNITGITQANPGVVTSNAHGFANDDQVYIAGVGGMTALNGRWFIVAGVTANTFTLKDQVTGAAINTTSLAAYTSGGTVARVYEIDSPYLEEDLFELNFTQSADVMTITNKNYAPRELRRNGLTNWVLSTISFTPTASAPTGVSVTINAGGSQTDRYAVTAIDGQTGQESLAGLNATSRSITGITQANPGVVTATAHGFLEGDEVLLQSIGGMTQLNGRRVRVSNPATDTFQLRELDGTAIDTTGFTAYTSGGTATQAFVRITSGHSPRNNTISWTAVAGATRYAVYREKAGIFGLIGESVSTSFTDSNIDPDTEDGLAQFRNPFSAEDRSPSAVAYWEQRRVFGGSIDKPDTTNYSRIGDQSNFAKSEPLRDDDAIEAVLPAQRVNEIRHFVPVNDLLVLTSGSEWRVNSGPDSAFTPATVKQKPQSFWGAAWMRPVTIGSTTLFVEESQTRVRSIGFSLQIEGYTGTDLNILASHLFERYKIVDWALAKYPDTIVHAIREDGELASLTFQQEQEVIAWSRWRTDGKFLAAASLPRSGDEPHERLYVVVRRIINGNTVQYVERLDTSFAPAVEDYFFVDCGLTYDVPVAISGVSLANPGVVTANAHGFVNGDLVDISDIVWKWQRDEAGGYVQPDQLNGRRFKVAGATANTFQLQDLDGNNVDTSAFVAYLEGGFVRKAVQTLSGLWHREGETVVALCDGNVVEDLVVTNGSITLPRRFSRVHVGLTYISEVETLDLEIPQGTVQGKQKTIGRLILRFQEAGGCFYGYDFDAPEDMIEIKDRTEEDYDQPTEPTRGFKEVYMAPHVNNHGRVCIRQRYPLPMTLLAVIPDYTFEEYEGRND